MASSDLVIWLLSSLLLFLVIVRFLILHFKRAKPTKYILPKYTWIKDENTRLLLPGLM